jgi:hypothetical protein
MKRKTVTIVSLASSLAAIAPAVHASVTKEAPAPETAPKAGADPAVGRPNAFYNFGGDIMGLVATTKGDGTVVAQHSSHVSHASHASHYSSR